MSSITGNVVIINCTPSPSNTFFCQLWGDSRKDVTDGGDHHDRGLETFLPLRIFWEYDDIPHNIG